MNFYLKKNKWDIDDNISIIYGENDNITNFYINREKERNTFGIGSSLEIMRITEKYSIVIEKNEYFDGLNEDEKFLREKFIEIHDLAKVEKEKYGYQEKLND